MDTPYVFKFSNVTGVVQDNDCGVLLQFNWQHRVSLSLHM